MSADVASATAGTRPLRVHVPPPGASGAGVPTGVRGLDVLTGGGFPAGRSVVLVGGPGTGKTALALQFAGAGLASAERAIYVTADQKPRHLVPDARALGLDLAAAVETGALQILDASPYLTALGAGRPADARDVASELAAHVRAGNVRRLVLDPLTSLVPVAATGDALRHFLRTVIQAVEDNLGCTTVLTACPWHPASVFIEHVASGVIDLRLDRSPAGLARKIVVRKLRGATAPPAERVFDLLPGRGVHVYL